MKTENIWKPINELKPLDTKNNFTSVDAFIRFSDGTIQRAHITNGGIFTDPKNLPRKRDEIKEYCTLSEALNKLLG